MKQTGRLLNNKSWRATQLSLNKRAGASPSESRLRGAPYLFEGGRMLWHERLWRNLVDCVEEIRWWVEENAVNIGSGALFILVTIVFWLVLFLAVSKQCHAAENWKITSYCACQKCCGKTDAITASGKKAAYGMVACNWLPFGTKLKIGNLGVFVVADRGAKSLFGDKRNHIKHLDLFLPTHRQALLFGVKYLPVEVL